MANHKLFKNPDVDLFVLQCISIWQTIVLNSLYNKRKKDVKAIEIDSKSVIKPE